MSSPSLSPFSLARTFVFRRYFMLRRRVATAAAVDLAEKAARKRRKKAAKNERLRNFYGWWEGCAAYGSIF